MEQIKQPDWRAEIQKVIDGSEQGMEAEMARSANPWPLVLITRFQHLMITVRKLNENGLITIPTRQSLEELIQKRAEEVHKLEKAYPDRDSPPSDEIKKEYMKKLDILSD